MNDSRICVPFQFRAGPGMCGFLSLTLPMSTTQSLRSVVQLVVQSVVQSGSISAETIAMFMMEHTEMRTQKGLALLGLLENRR